MTPDSGHGRLVVTRLDNWKIFIWIIFIGHTLWSHDIVSLLESKLEKSLIGIKELWIGLEISADGKRNKYDQVDADMPGVCWIRARGMA